jgi:hypothetical protein
MISTKVLVNCKQYGRFTDVLFMMKTDDFRLADSKYGYTKIADGKHVTKERSFVTTTGETYQVFSDWSVKKI